MDGLNATMDGPLAPAPPPAGKTMQSAGLRARLESALGKRVPTPFTDLSKRVHETVSTGIAELDVLTGGLPRGAITEIFGPLCSGRTRVMLSLLAVTTARDEVCALVDGSDAFDPSSGAAAGVDLKRLLWTRCKTLGQVLRATDLLLQGGGFGLVLMDLTDIPEREIQSISLATWFRFQRAIEKTPTILVVLGQENAIQSAASLVLRLEMDRVEWNGGLLGANRVGAEIVRSRFQHGNIQTHLVAAGFMPAATK